MDAITEPTVEPADEERVMPCEVYSRIVGYLRPVQNWNAAKQAEFEERVTFNVEEVLGVNV